jgi:hypothetical protein
MLIYLHLQGNLPWRQSQPLQPVVVYHFQKFFIIPTMLTDPFRIENQ